MYKNQLLPVSQTRIGKKAKERYSKEKAGKYYLQNKEAIKEKSKKKKTKLKTIKEKDSNWFSTKKKHYKINKFYFTNYKNGWKDTKIWQY